MFKPNFQYTDKIVGDLTQVAAARELVLNSPFIPKWEVSLRREAIIRSAHSSTAIEGNRLSLEQVSDLAQGCEIMATRKDKQEVLNYPKVLETIDKVADDRIGEYNAKLQLEGGLEKGIARLFIKTNTDYKKSCEKK